MAAPRTSTAPGSTTSREGGFSVLLPNGVKATYDTKEGADSVIAAYGGTHIGSDDDFGMKPLPAEDEAAIAAAAAAELAQAADEAAQAAAAEEAAQAEAAAAEAAAALNVVVEPKAEAKKK